MRRHEYKIDITPDGNLTADLIEAPEARFVDYVEAKAEIDKRDAEIERLRNVIAPEDMSLVRRAVEMFALGIGVMPVRVGDLVAVVDALQKCLTGVHGRDSALTAARAALDGDSNLIRLADADVLADEVAALVTRRALDARSPVADALLQYRGNPRSERSDRIASLEAALDGEREHANAARRCVVVHDGRETGTDATACARWRQAHDQRRAAESKEPTWST